MHQPSLLAAFTAVLASVPSAQAGMYTKNSPVLQLDHKNFNDEIMKTNYTSVSHLSQAPQKFEGVQY